MLTASSCNLCRARTHPLPQVTRVYQNHHLDSTRWQAYVPRASDIVVSTSYKAGTTWTQQILSSLLRGTTEYGPHSPWVDCRFVLPSKVELAARLEALPDRRFLKSHLPLDGMPFFPEVRYVVVARDPRDVFMSLLNHFKGTNSRWRELLGPEEPALYEAAKARELEPACARWLEQGGAVR